MTRPFRSELVIEEKISEANFRAYHVGYEQNKFRLKPLVDILLSVIPEFALGYQEGKVVPINEIVTKIREASRTIYGPHGTNRGELGELILHLLLRDFHNTVPLVSKIYFKDAENTPVHGFDGVHITIEPENKKLWLGESKLYTDGIAGVKELAKDIEKHLKADYLRSEFTLIRHKLPKEGAPEVEYWRNFLDEHNNLDSILNGICIPVVCTYSSDAINAHTNAGSDYLRAFTAECQKLKDVFHKKLISTSVEILLLLLPVSTKNELLEEFDKNLVALRME